jgi:hypothetical protein
LTHEDFNFCGGYTGIGTSERKELSNLHFLEWKCYWKPQCPREVSKERKPKKKKKNCQVSVSHTNHPSHTGPGHRDQDNGLKPAGANSSQDPISKNPSQKNRAGEVTQGIGPELEPQYCKK